MLETGICRTYTVKRWEQTPLPASMSFDRATYQPSEVLSEPLSISGLLLMIGSRTGRAWSQVRSATRPRLQRCSTSAAAKLLLFIAIGLPALAQPEPDTPEVFLRLDGSTLTSLERQNPVIKSKVRGYIVMATTVTVQVRGAKSPIRIPAGQIEFAVKAIAADPQAVFVLRRLESKKSLRQVVITRGHSNPVHASLDTNVSDSNLPIEFSRYGGSVKISATLTPGEYAIGRPVGPALFCFGVD